ncbi:hypothetical protein GCM10007276_33650 [Agaricicola taiwanensis]|uniref:DUF1468 domain-containing protein n=1 Tax=Agaricicola taiwanensis TaxID=591372 RepID=A0A8J2YM78_9RHOB|nr:tripartite tricarboxylate transporter TctB family protein [Agaricicola taiwanensis]GGE53845.1 hypothetical protein GCM10007276_33650 [Agaricicola taiwanensis]
MQNWRIDKTDLVGGGLMALVGFLVFLESLNYDMGDMASIGPGFFPRALGIIVVICGLGVAAMAFLHDGVLPKPNWRAVATIAASILAFAGLIQTFGLVPAIFATVILARLGEAGFNWRQTVLTAMGLSLFCYLIFVLGLSIPFAVVRWPL